MVGMELRLWTQVCTQPLPLASYDSGFFYYKMEIIIITLTSQGSWRFKCKVRRTGLGTRQRLSECYWVLLRVSNPVGQGGRSGAQIGELSRSYPKEADILWQMHLVPKIHLTPVILTLMLLTLLISIMAVYAISFSLCSRTCQSLLPKCGGCPRSSLRPHAHAAQK